MKSTGIVRRVDDLGRVCLPVELRRTLNIQEGDPFEILVSSDGIVLRKYHPTGSCTLCGSIADRYIELGQYRICLGCSEQIVAVFQQQN